MKRKILSLLVLACSLAVHGAGIGITSLASNGRLTWTNSFTNGLFTMEWAPALGTNWHSDWNLLQNAWVSGRTNTVDVPMFYRVKCATNLLWPLPAGGQFVFSVSNVLGNVSTGQVHVLGYVRPLMPGTNDYALLESLRAGGTSLNLLRSTDTTVTKLDLCNQTEATEFQAGPAGTTWTNYNYQCQYVRKVTVDAIEDVTMPAGTFTGCYKLHKQILSGTTASRPEWYEWVKPGFGLCIGWIIGTPMPRWYTDSSRGVCPRRMAGPRPRPFPRPPRD